MVSRWFRISFAENALRRHLDEIGSSPADLRAPGALAAMAGFYRASRAQHASIPHEGDGLRWLWGPSSDGSRFTTDLTRQLIREGDDQPIVQLTLCLAYRWTPARRELGRGSTDWCFDPDAAGDFERAVRRSDAYRAVAAAAPVEVVLRSDTL